ncbi:hypothetical protein [Phenylobacterium aquaticum]|uniref:hypothetical protein n=1 Tax=Phenylobacterium aquaticum TaxID=1763816 RepID=UPI0026EE66F9|nr:hypothetical protein [Phenylobacterium aquaticum]
MARLKAMVLGVASSLAALSAAQAAARCDAPTPPLFPAGVEVIRTIRVYTGADGESHFEDKVTRGVTHPFFKTDKLVAQNIFGPSPKVSLVSGPADQAWPARPGGPGMFLGLAGSSFVTLPNGEEREIAPGVLAVFEDQASKTGHGGRSGPCGYVTLSIAPTPPVAPATDTPAPAH